MSKISLLRSFVFYACWSLILSSAVAQSPATATTFRLNVAVPTDAKESLQIPRYHAPLRAATWSDTSVPISVVPEPDYWIVSWKERPQDADSITLTFDASPLENAIDVVAKQWGDGRVDLHAFAATTTGEKLRFEPQPHKNTVGYWVRNDDFATWTMDLDRGGVFNVGILQGCGKGQGNSDMRFSVMRRRPTRQRTVVSRRRDGTLSEFHLANDRTSRDQQTRPLHREATADKNREQSGYGCSANSTGAIAGIGRVNSSSVSTARRLVIDRGFVCRSVVLFTELVHRFDDRFALRRDRRLDVFLLQ